MICCDAAMERADHVSVLRQSRMSQRNKCVLSFVLYLYHSDESYPLLFLGSGFVLEYSCSTSLYSILLLQHPCLGYTECGAILGLKL